MPTIKNYTLFIAAILICTVNAFGREHTRLKKRDILREINIQKNRHNHANHFQVPYDSLRNAIIRYIEANPKFTFQERFSYDKIIFTTFTSVYSEVFDYYSPHLEYNRINNLLSHVSVFTIVSLEITPLNNTTYMILSDARLSNAGNIFIREIQNTYQFKYLLCYLNNLFKGNWQPETELRDSIDQYNRSKKRSKRQLLPGRDF